MGFYDIGELMLQPPGSVGYAWPNTLEMTLVLSRVMGMAERQPLTHGAEVALLAVTLADELALLPEARQTLLHAGLLHDIGLLPLLAGLSAEEEAALHTHAETLLTRRTPLAPNLHCHLEVPPLVIESLRLPPAVVNLIARHHPFWESTGFLPLSGSTEVERLHEQLLAFSDAMVTVMSQVSGFRQRHEAAITWLSSEAAHRFLPELATAFSARFAEPEAIRLLDPRGLTDAVRARWIGPTAYLSSPEVLALCHWLGDCADGRQPGYTRNEARQTADLMVLMGQRLGLPQEALGQLALAGYLHDVGKLILPRDLLDTDRSVHGPEWDCVAQHTQILEVLLSDISGLNSLVPWLVAHHEHLNGSGYPYGLRRQEIPVGARILALADAYVALTQPRPYRPLPYRPQDALDILNAQQGRLYDPSLLQVLAEAVVLVAEPVV